MREILASSQHCYGPNSTLKWENVIVSSNKEILMFVPNSKSKGFEGKIIDLYPIKDCKFCPSASLLRLNQMLTHG